MITHGQVDPVGIKSILGVSKHAANIKSVIFAGIEVSVVAYKHRHQQLLLTCLKNSLSQNLLAQRRMSRIK